ncbi:MAG: hypothetical protein LBM65_03620 [Oscillospiraceae bacterium]|jgi:hypothetical protein|nr:hypothetical protein [Oscillospiraceae bacterium]
MNKNNKTLSDALRYMGVKTNPPPELLTQVAAALDEIKAAARPCNVQREFEAQPCSNGLHILGTSLVLPGEDIKNFVFDKNKCKALQNTDSNTPKSSTKIKIFAATLGAGVDMLLTRTAALDAAQALVLDACATALIEEYCDTIAPLRFSPGYGDLPIETQPEILNVLNAGRAIGLSCTQNFIMIPRKSVSAIALADTSCGESLPNKCASCTFEGCISKLC